MYMQAANLLRVMLVVLAGALGGWAIVLSRTLQPCEAAPKPAMSRMELNSMALLVLVGAVLRLQRMGESLWYDEVSAWQSYGQYGPGPIVGNFADPSNHILHTLLSWLGVTLTNPFVANEIALRLAAFIASLISIAVVYALARRAADLFTAILAGALFAIWPVCVLEGAEARGYSMMMLFAALATLLLVMAMERRRALLWLLYALAIALGVWAHMVTVFVAIGHGAWLVSRLFGAPTRRDALAGLTSLVLAAVTTVTLLAPALPEMLAKRDVVEVTDANQPGPFGAEGLHAILQLGGSWLWIAALPGLALLCVGVWVIVTQRDSKLRSAVIAGSIGLPMAYVLVIAMGTWVYARFLLFVMPIAALVAAVGWRWLWNKIRWAGIVFVIVIAGASGFDLVTRPPKQPLREASDYVYNHGGKGARVLVISIAHSVLDAYSDGLEVATSFRLGAAIESDLDRTKPNWIIVLYPEKVDRATYDVLNAHGFTKRAHFDGWVDWGHGDIDIYALGDAGVPR